MLFKMMALALLLVGEAAALAPVDPRCEIVAVKDAQMPSSQTKQVGGSLYTYASSHGGPYGSGDQSYDLSIDHEGKSRIWIRYITIGPGLTQAKKCIFSFDITPERAISLVRKIDVLITADQKAYQDADAAERNNISKGAYPTPPPFCSHPSHASFNRVGERGNFYRSRNCGLVSVAADMFQKDVYQLVVRYGGGWPS